ncbi:MAG: hypothetical protein MI754_00075, partial [Chromatiales bacterium]|nr:hypothetical protein [Chromatiales bacterium]
NFYEDPYQGTAALVTGMFGAAALVVPVYGGWSESQERNRIHAAQERIDTLRQLKAEKRCFVS